MKWYEVERKTDNKIDGNKEEKGIKQKESKTENKIVRNKKEKNELQ